MVCSTVTRILVILELKGNTNANRNSKNNMVIILYVAIKKICITTELLFYKF